MRIVDGALISGNLTLDRRQLNKIDDHHSLMVHFRREVLAKWGIDEEEYKGMIEEHYCELGGDIVVSYPESDEVRAVNG